MTALGLDPKNDSVNVKTNASSSSVHVALLRGINVGGKNKLSMNELAGCFESAGCEQVRTYIQSGNVVFRVKPSVAKSVPEIVARSIADVHGYRVPIVMREAASFREVIETNPFVKAGRDPKSLHVVFLAGRPGVEELARIDPERSPPDELCVVGSQVFLCCPNSVARTKLTIDYFERRLSTTSTMRNWRTVLKLAAITEEAERGTGA